MDLDVDLVIISPYIRPDYATTRRRLNIIVIIILFQLKTLVL